APIQIDAVANKSSYFDMFMISIQRRQLLRCRSLSYDLAGRDQHIALLNDDNLGAASRERFVGLADIPSRADLFGYNVDFQFLSGSLDFSALRASFWVSHIVEQSNARRSGNKFACKFKLLCWQIGHVGHYSSYVSTGSRIAFD